MKTKQRSFRRILTCKAADVCDCRRTARPVLCAETPLPLPRAVPLVPPGARVLDPVRKEAVKCVGELCKQQLALCLRDANGEVLDCTGVQIGMLLDHCFRYDGALGCDDGVQFHLWAPSAVSVELLLYDGPRKGTASVQSMSENQGVWSLQGSRRWVGKYYNYKVQAYHPSTGRIETMETPDPYCLACSADAGPAVTRRMICELPPCPQQPPLPPFSHRADAAIYELHVRDFSAKDDSVAAKKRGSYLAFEEEGTVGDRHLRRLADSGISHVHLLPTFDFGSVPERCEERLEAEMPSKAGPDSEGQQMAVMEVADQDAFNWGYDPVLFGVPEGSYASDPDGLARVLEHRRMHGVDGPRLLLYGEGWEFGEIAQGARGVTAVQRSLAGTGVGSFNDGLRGAALGGNAFEDPRIQGFCTGLALRQGAEEVQQTNAKQMELLRIAADNIRLCMAGGLKDYKLLEEAVNFICVHDNETLYDSTVWKMPAVSTTPEEHVLANWLCTAILALGHGVPLFHAGDEVLRSKSLDRDSYNSGDWFNWLDFTGKRSGFGRARRPAQELMKPLLRDQTLAPTPQMAQKTTEKFCELLRIRRSTPLRLGVVFGRAGMRCEHRVEIPASYTNGSLQVHPLHAESTDELTREARVDLESNELLVPPMSAIVFVEPEEVLPTGDGRAGRLKFKPAVRDRPIRGNGLGRWAPHSRFLGELPR
eukprot:g19488.t1